MRHIEHYNLRQMFLNAKKGEPAYQILWDWWGGASELTTVNKLRELGLIKTDTFIDQEPLTWHDVAKIRKAYAKKNNTNRKGLYA